MVVIRFREFKTVEDLERRVRAARVEDKINRLRQQVRIGVIDDKNFAPLNNLRRHAYDITTFKDVSSIDSLVDFQILLVDLQGVGRDLNPTLQGAHVIREIKKNFPDKFVIAYTGGASQELLAPSIEAANRFTQKDTSIEAWCELLDEAIIEISNPAYVWKSLRARLLSAGVSPFELAELEDEFVRSFEESPVAYKERLKSKADELKIPQSARSIINSLIASAVLELFKSLLAS